LVAHLHFFPTHKPTLKNAKELPSQHTTTQQTEKKNKTQKKGDRTTAVWQYGGFSAKLNIRISNKH
jgi:hypothetical protein